MFGIGSDEHEPALADHLREIRILREEPVAGMDRLGAGDLGRSEDGDLVQVGLARRRRPDAHAGIGEPDVHGVGIRGGMDGHALDAHFPARPDHAQCDLASVRHQHLIEHGTADHGYRMIRRSSPYSTGSPFDTRSLAIRPLRDARMGFTTFIASMMRSV